ncbi:MAG: pyridoxamine 5'-phosphate oxidase family protein [Elsteraceae bacterium]
MITPASEDLATLLSDCWTRLETGAVDRRSALHQAVVATVDPGGAPDARIMVLRMIDREQRLAQLHTDRRAAKLLHLSREPRASLLFYDPEVRVQLRLAGSATIHQDDAVAEAAWARSRRMSRVCYAAEIAPGAEIDDPSLALGHLAGAEGVAGYENFAVLRFRIDRLEWLSLAAKGHRRARFLLAGSAPVGQWLAP